MKETTAAPVAPCYPADWEAEFMRGVTPIGEARRGGRCSPLGTALPRGVVERDIRPPRRKAKR